MQVQEKLLHQLNQIEDQLKLASLWSAQAPAKKQLQSALPFSVDTLTPEEWLQWIFIPQIRDKLQSGEALMQMNITPYFVQCWGYSPQKKALLSAIYQFEQLS